MTQTECDSEMRAIAKELLALAERLHQLQINRPGAKFKTITLSGSDEQILVPVQKRRRRQRETV